MPENEKNEERGDQPTKNTNFGYQPTKNHAAPPPPPKTGSDVKTAKKE